MRGQVLALWAVIAVGVVAAPTAAAAPGADAACAAAAAATADARPGDALVYLRGTRPPATPAQQARVLPRGGAAPLATPPSCPTEHAAAIAAIERAAGLTDSAYLWQPGGVAPYPGADESWGESLDRAEQALALDAGATSGRYAVSAAALRTEALGHLPVHAAADSADSWWRTLTGGAKHLGAPLLTLVGALAALLLAARLLAPVTLYWPVLRSPERFTVGVAGLLLTVVGLLVLGFGATVTTTGVDAPGSWAGASEVARWLLFWCGAAGVVVACTNTVRRRGRPALDRRRRTPTWSASTGLLGLGVGLLALAGVPPLWLGLVSCALGVLLVATLLATRLRLVVEVRGKGSGEPTATGADTGSTRLVALLGELAGRPSGGVQVPRGTDVDRLGGAALAELPANAILKVAMSVVQGLFGSTPWQVRVEDGDPESLSVVMTRNGRTASTATYERSTLVAFGIAKDVAAQADLLRAAAATVVTTLAEHHTGFEGLCGATDARSLARYYVAITDLRDDAAARQALLAYATDADPENWLAQVALGNAVGDRATEVGELEAYARWIGWALRQISVRGPSPLWSRIPWSRIPWLRDRVAEAGGVPRGFEGLRLRLLFNRAVTDVNLAFARKTAAQAPAPAGAPATTQAVTSATTVDGTVVTDVVELWQALAEQAGRHGAAHRRNAHLVAELADASLGMVRRAQHALQTTPSVVPDATATLRELTQSWTAVTGRAALPSDDEPARTPTGAYNLACWAATTDGIGTQVALRHLRQSFALQENREWVEQDPVLAPAVEAGAFRALLAPAPLREILAVPMLAGHAAKLRALGIETADGLAHASWEDLAGHLMVSPLEARTMIRVAALATSLPPSPAQVDLALVLLRSGHAGPPADARADTCQQIVATVRRLNLTPAEVTKTLDDLVAAGWQLPVSVPLLPA